MLKRVKLLDIPMDSATMTESIQFIDRRIKQRVFTQHVVVNTAKVVNMLKDAELKKSVESCDLINIDGMGVVWALKFLGLKIHERVTGIDLFFSLLTLAEEKGYPVFLLGARQAIVELAVKRLQKKNPGIKIAGFHHGYFWDQEKEVVDKIKSSGAKLLFVAISSPKKEAFIHRWHKQLGVDFVMGVGGTFDVVAGKVKRAPVWMQKTGLEWFFRLLQEPGRMWKRYLFTNYSFVSLLLKEKLFTMFSLASNAGQISYISWSNFSRRADQLCQAISARCFYTGNLINSRGLLWKTLFIFDYLYKTIITLVYLWRFRPAIVMVQAPPSFTPMVSLIYCRLSKAKLIVDGHNFAFEPPWDTIPLYPRSLKKADLVLVHNDELHNHLKKKYPQVIFRVLPDFIPTIDVSGSQRCAVTADHDYILVVFSFSHDEPVDLVLAALQQYGKKNNTRFLITGKFQKRIDLYEKYHSKNLHFLGFVNDETYLSLLGNAHGVIATSTREMVQQCAAVEAMGAHIPLIISDSVTSRRMFFKGAVFTDNDIDCIVKAISTFNQKHEELAEGIKEVASHHRKEWLTSWDNIKTYLSKV